MVLFRQQLRRELRPYGEHIVTSVLGNVPRSIRRRGGRYYANEAYRVMVGLPSLRGANPAATNWIIREYETRTSAPNLPEVPRVKPEDVGNTSDV